MTYGGNFEEAVTNLLLLTVRNGPRSLGPAMELSLGGWSPSTEKLARPDPPKIGSKQENHDARGFHNNERKSCYPFHLQFTSLSCVLLYCIIIILYDRHPRCLTWLDFYITHVCERYKLQNLQIRQSGSAAWSSNKFLSMSP